MRRLREELPRHSFPVPRLPVRGSPAAGMAFSHLRTRAVRDTPGVNHARNFRKYCLPDALVVCSLHFAVAPWRNHRLTSTEFNGFDNIIRIIPLIADHIRELQPLNQVHGFGEIGLLALGNEKSYQPATGVNRGVNLRGQAAARTPLPFGFALVFLAAPC
jgi:hypothetical protein